MKRIVGALIVFSMLALGACRDGGPTGEHARLDLDGTAVIERPDGSTETVDSDVTVDFGDRVTLSDGRGSLELPGGQIYELVAGAHDSDVLVDATPQVLGGRVLLSEGFPIPARFEEVTVTALGAAVIDAVEGAVSVYTGRVTVSGSGVDEVSALRRLVLADDAEPTPVGFDADDPWDRTYLGEAVAFGERLEALARGYTADLTTVGRRGAVFYEAVLPALGEQREFNDVLISDLRPVGETLVGAAITVQGRLGTFTERWNEVFAFRDEGALWGIVALDQQVSDAPLLDTIELAIEQTPGAPAPTTSSSVDVPTTPSTDPSGPPTSTPPTGPTTTEPPPPPTSEPPLLDPVVDTVEGLLDTILGLLGSE